MTAEAYLTECGWNRVDQSMGASGWEHPSEPGKVLDTPSALVAQGSKQPPNRHAPRHGQWGGFDNER